VSSRGSGLVGQAKSVVADQTDANTSFRSVCGDNDHDVHHILEKPNMISHADLYNIANSLGALAMITVVAYHVVAVNARHLASKNANGIAGSTSH